ncbi:MAG: signal peptidase II [Clostridiales Family XIII bacterium]|jgi:signal peptidase II|nr:signal peptidase II [Clostridiales Family XIII bacterium]
MSKAIVVGVILLSVALDRVSKFIVITHMTLGQSYPPGDHFISFFYTRNEGVAFSMFDDMSWRWILVGVQSVLVIVLVVMLCVLLKRRSSVLPLVTLSLMLGGGIGNLIDRIAYGSVIDFVSVGSFPVFNVADSCLTVGCAIMIAYLLFFQKHDDNKTE